MNQALNQERLSALLDNELTEFELRQILRDSSAEELQVLSRWQLAQDAMHGKPVVKAPHDFATQVQAAIGQEPQRKKQQWWSGIAKTMVAASVAAATVTVGWQYWQADDVGAGLAPVNVASPSAQHRFDQGAASTELVSQPLSAQKRNVSSNDATIELISPLLQPVQSLQTDPIEADEAPQQPQIHFIGK